MKKIQFYLLALLAVAAMGCKKNAGNTPAGPGIYVGAIKATSNMADVTVTCNKGVAAYASAYLYYSTEPNVGKDNYKGYCSIPRDVDYDVDGKKFTIESEITAEGFTFKIGSVYLLYPNTPYYVRAVVNFFDKDGAFIEDMWSEEKTFVTGMPVFSVAKGKTVTMAPSNLFSISDGVNPRFCAMYKDQLKYAGTSNVGTSYTDLLGWGTGNNLVFRSTQESDYTEFKDWGMNAIKGDFTYPSYTWRSLSKDEWEYLLFEREKLCEGKYLMEWAKHNDTKEIFLIIAPDGMLGNNYFEGVEATNGSPYSWNSDQVQRLTDWGCVLLPLSGIRQNDNYENSYEAYYWTSTPGELVGAYAVKLQYGSDPSVSVGTMARQLGGAIRMAKNN